MPMIYIIQRIPRLARAGVMIAALMTATGCTQAWLNPLDVGEEISPEYGDVILVLGGGLRPNLALGYSTEERLKLAVSLYRRTPRHLLVTDGSLYRRSPAVPRLRQWLIRRGVLPQHIVFEGRSQNTWENLSNGLEILQRRGFRQVIACTSPYHQARVKLIMRYLGYPDFRIARMRESEIRSDSGIRQLMRNLRLIVREYFAILHFYLFRH